MYRQCLIVGFCLLVCSLLAQERFPFRQLQKGDGLSQNSVIGIAQDGKGFMWFGTRDGLNRYDGREFRVYRGRKGEANGLVFNDIHTLYYDETLEWLWVGTTRGLCRYREDTDDFVAYEGDPLLAGQYIQFIRRDSRGILWVGTERGLFRYRAETDAFERIGRLPVQAFRAMVEDGAGGYLVGLSTGLFRLQLGEADTTGSLTRIPLTGDRAGEEVYVQDLLPETGGYLWVASRFSGLYRLHLESGDYTRYTVSGGDLSDNNVRDIEWGEDGSLWVGTFVGLNRLVPGTDRVEMFYEAPYQLNSLQNNSIHSLFTDRRGTLWLGSYFGGVAYYDPRLEGVRHYDRKGTGLNSEVVSAFAETAQGDLWIGTEGGGLNFFDRSADTIGPYRSGAVLPSNNVKRLLPDGDRLWIATYQGQLVYLDTRSGEVIYDWGPVSDSVREDLNNVYDLLLRNDTLWVGSYGKSLTLVDLRSGQSTRYAEQTRTDSTLASNQIRSLYEDRSGNVWMATQEGVSRITATPDGKLRFRHYLEDQIVYALGEDSRGNIWAGTYGNGLFIIDPAGREPRHYSGGDGVLSEGTVYGILRDGRGQLWISSNEGVMEQDRASGGFRNANSSYNLRDEEYRINAALLSRSGELIFGGTQGMTLFDPSDNQTATVLPPLVFTRLQVANREVTVEADGGLLVQHIDNTHQLTLPYDNANFSLSFAPLDFLSAGKYRFEYRLDGLDETWVPSRGETTASYTLQNSGRYRFRVRMYPAGRPDGYVERTMDIRILPPFWRSWYAYLAYSALLGLLIFAAVRQALLRQHLRKERRNKQQQEALHQAKLRFFTNVTHELRTPLTLMLGPLESVRRGGTVQGEAARRLLTVENNSRRLLQLVNELLTFRKLNGERDPMDLEAHDLVAVCREIVQAFEAYAATTGKHLRLLTDAESHRMTFDRDKLEKVIYNLLANAFKFTEAGGHITLRLRREGNLMHVEVRDDGEGIPEEMQEKIFARFFEHQSLTSREGTGIGLAVAREYVEMHGGEISVSSQPGCGSTFRLWLPFRPPVAPWYAETVIPPPEAPPGEIERLRERLKGDQPDGKPALILIVEDNEEVRDYIESVLVEDYRLITASDGREGLELAGREHPDLVISDVMMPVMDGIALCEALKRDLTTSHIPVVLLTAKSGDLQKLEGLENGANDYITKPFSPRELQLRVQNLLHSIRSARERTGRTLRLEPTEVQVTSADADFLERAIDAINAQMDNSDYRVDDFARDLAVSRALLFTKMKAITGHTPNNFMKLLRMKRAAQLLETGELLVSEVAARVGYRDVKYFSSSFAKAHGCNPSVYGCQEETS